MDIDFGFRIYVGRVSGSAEQRSIPTNIWSSGECRQTWFPVIFAHWLRLKIRQRCSRRRTWLGVRRPVLEDNPFSPCITLRSKKDSHPWFWTSGCSRFHLFSFPYSLRIDTTLPWKVLLTGTKYWIWFGDLRRQQQMYTCEIYSSPALNDALLVVWINVHVVVHPPQTIASVLKVTASQACAYRSPWASYSLWGCTWINVHMVVHRTWVIMLLSRQFTWEVESARRRAVPRRDRFSKFQ